MFVFIEEKMKQNDMDDFEEEPQIPKKKSKVSVAISNKPFSSDEDVTEDGTNGKFT